MADFFLLGAGRSGTTLLRTILSGHSEIAVAPESYFTVPLLKRTQAFTTADAWRIIVSSESFREWNLTLEQVEDVWARLQPTDVRTAIQAFYRAYGLSQGKRLVGDKTPYHCQHADLLAQAFPQARFVVIERDGRSVARSAQAESFGSRSFLIAARRWSRDVVAVDRTRARLPGRFVTVRYETLTQQPDSEVRRVCDFLEVEYEEQMLDTPTTGSRLLQHMRVSEHVRRVAEPIAARPNHELGRVREGGFRAVAGEGLQVLGEPTPTPRTRTQVVAGLVSMADRSLAVGRHVRGRAGSLVGRRPVTRFARTPAVRATVSKPDEVTALVLTYSAPKELARCLTALADQSERPASVLVLDNGGRPPELPADISLPIQLVRSSTNTGPAGGWADLLHLGARTGSGWLWLLDDDCAPDRTALQQLRRCAQTTGARAVMPIISEDRTGKVRRYPAWTGPLLDAGTLDRVGLPRRELVWWGEDSEFLQVRLRDCGFPLVFCDTAVVHHSMARRGAKPPLWKLYYETRNSIWLRIRVRQQYASPTHMLRLGRTVLAATRTAAGLPTPLAGLSAVALGLVHGMDKVPQTAPKRLVGPTGPRFVPAHEIVLRDMATGDLRRAGGGDDKRQGQAVGAEVAVVRE